MEFHRAQLDNGLQIIAEVNPAAVSLAAGFFVRTGSRDETANLAGVSHFLEHMVFKGTDRRSARDVNLQFDRLGALYNAFTSEENTVYFGSVLPEFQGDLMDLLCDMMRPALRDEDFQTEKGVIREEIAMYEDRPAFRLFEKLMALHFGDHPLGNAVLGTDGSIEAMKRDEMLGYFQSRYSPTNIVLIATGAIDFAKLTDQAAQLCSAWEPFDARPRGAPPEPPANGSNALQDSKLARQCIGWMHPAPSCQDENRFAAQLASTILGDSTGSRMYYALVETALADEAHVSYSPMDGAGSLMTFASCDPDRTAEVADAVGKVFETFTESGPTEAELQSAKNKIATEATLKGEMPMGRLTAVGMDWVYRSEYMPLADQIERLFDVTGEEVWQIARDANFPAGTRLSLGPGEAKD